MSTALSTGRTGGEPGAPPQSGEPSVSESAATKRRTERERERRRKVRRAQKSLPGGGFLRKLLLVSFKGVAFAADAVYDVAEDFGIGF